MDHVVFLMISSHLNRGAGCETLVFRLIPGWGDSSYCMRGISHYLWGRKYARLRGVELLYYWTWVFQFVILRNVYFSIIRVKRVCEVRVVLDW